MAIKKTDQDKNPFFIGIGASAGGLDALNRLFDKLPVDLNAVYIVVQHLSPKHKSMMAELLAKHTEMPVSQVTGDTVPQTGSVYLIPPNHNIILEQGKFRLVKPLEGLNLPIDMFLRSLAEAKGRRTVGIILSGTGSDGSQGIKALKGCGGLTIAQQENTAQFDGMPHSAIKTGMIDLVLPPEEMGDAIAHFTRHPFSQQPWIGEEQLKKQMDLIGKILAIVQSRTGVDFNFYKETTIFRRLERRLTINQISKVEDYLTMLQENGKEADALYQDLLIGVTNFFRDQPAFDFIQNNIIPEIFKNATDNQLRVWSVGCSTGDEPYSLAMLLADYRDQQQLATEIKVFATDIDASALAKASDGIYPDNISADIPARLLQRYFIPLEHGFKVSEHLRRMVVFANHNIIKDPPFSRLDLIVCRNMLIYLKPDIQQKVLTTFHFSLLENGFLFLGNSESVGDLQDAFPPVSSKLKIFHCNKERQLTYGATLQFARQLHSRLPIKLEQSQGRDSDTRRDRMFNDYCRKIFSEFVPASIIVNETHEIVHICSDAHRFLYYPVGKTTLNLLKVIHPELATPLNTLLHKAASGDQQVDQSNLLVRDKENEKRTPVHLSVRPLKSDYPSPVYYAVVVVEQQQLNRSDEEEKIPESSKKQSELIKDLQFQLQQSRENHQAAMEELETSNEELQSTNEELIASNEELQSTNEELQSVNEELHTVNSEYQKKIDELSEVNNDMKNLLHNVDSGIIFLTTDFKLRLFTPESKRIFNFLEHDIGRPIDHFSHTLELENLKDLLDQVLDTLTPITMEVSSARGEEILLKILPYRTTNNAVEGIILSLTDITRVHEYDKALLREKELLRRVMENSPSPKTIVDKKGKILFANQPARQLFRLSESAVAKRAFDSPEWQITGMDGQPIPTDQLPYNIIMRTGSKISAYRHYISDGKGERILLSIYGAPVFDKKGKVDGVVFTIIREDEKEINQ